MDKRSKMIEALLDNDLNDISQELANGEQGFLENILRDGWKGYDQMTDQELEIEIKDREIDVKHFDPVMITQ